MNFLAAVLLASSAVHVQPTLAKAGDCGWVHGRFAFWNGSGIRRIWVVGTRHYLNLHDTDDDVPDHRFSMDNAWPHEHYYADFYVCAQQRFIPGHMQRVGLKAVRRLVVVPD